MKTKLVRFLRDEEGMTTVEYAVAGALITIAIVAAFSALSAKIAATVGIMDSALSG